MEHRDQTGSHSRVPPGLWVDVGLALGLSVAVTGAVGVPVLLLTSSVWWLSVGGLVALLLAGAYLGARRREPEPLYGTLLAVLYYGLVVALLLGAELLDALPDPLPGLAIGDSTFFFVSPLLMLAAGAGGSALGGAAALARRNSRV